MVTSLQPADSGLVRSFSRRAQNLTTNALSNLNSVVRLPSYRTALRSSQAIPLSDMRSYSQLQDETEQFVSASALEGGTLQRGLSVRAQAGTHRVENIVRAPSYRSVGSIEEEPVEQHVAHPPEYTLPEREKNEGNAIQIGLRDRDIVKNHELFNTESEHVTPYLMHAAADRFKTLVRENKIANLTLARPYMQNHPHPQVKALVSRRLMPLVNVHVAERNEGGYGTFKVRDFLFTTPSLWERPNETLKAAMRETTHLFLDNDALEPYEFEFLKQNAQSIPDVYSKLFDPRFQSNETQSFGFAQRPMSFIDTARSYLPVPSLVSSRSVLSAIRDLGLMVFGAGQRAVHEVQQCFQPRVEDQVDNDLRSFFGYHDNDSRDSF